MIKNGKLQCPRCQDTWMHQGQVEVFHNHTREHKGEGRRVIVSDAVQVDNDISTNPSYRRQGLRIHFDCERCGPVQGLVVYQHKGETFVEWEQN